MTRPRIKPPVNRQGIRLYRFGDEQRVGGWHVGGWTAVGSAIYYPGGRVVEYNGKLWIAVPIADTPPPLVHPYTRLQWAEDQRVLERIRQAAPRSEAGIKAAKLKRKALADRNKALIDRARNARALDPSEGRWALAGRLKCDGLTQQQIYRIIKPAFDD
jgi:hypothetical protein